MSDRMFCVFCGEDAPFLVSVTSATFGHNPAGDLSICADHMKSLLQWRKDQFDLATIPETT